MSATYTHLDNIELTEPPETIAGGRGCLAIGRTGVHLRSYVDEVAFVVDSE